MLKVGVFLNLHLGFLFCFCLNKEYNSAVRIPIIVKDENMWLVVEYSGL